MDNKRFIERTAKEDLQEDACETCEEIYQPVVWWQKNCSAKCRQIAYRKRNPRITPELMKDIQALKEDNLKMKEKLQME